MKETEKTCATAQVNKYQPEILEPLLLVDAAEAARRLSISKRHFLTMDITGRVGPKPVRLGGRVLWRAEELSKWVSRGCNCREIWLRENAEQG